jgi:hypothetical protein
MLGACVMSVLCKHIVYAYVLEARGAIRWMLRTTTVRGTAHMRYTCHKNNRKRGHGVVDLPGIKV